MLPRASKSFSERTTSKTPRRTRRIRLKKKVKVRRIQNFQKKKSQRRKRSLKLTKGIKFNKCSLRKTILLNLKDG